MAIHVDDCTIAAHPPELMVELKEKLGSHVEVTDLGKLHWLLGIEIACDCHMCTIQLSQQSYIEEIVC